MRLRKALSGKVFGAVPGLIRLWISVEKSKRPRMKPIRGASRQTQCLCTVSGNVPSVPRIFPESQNSIFSEAQSGPRFGQVSQSTGPTQ